MSSLTTSMPRLVGLFWDAWPRADRIARDTSILFGLAFGIGQAIGVLPQPGDLALYWNAGLQDPYAGTWHPGTSSTPYPPPFLVAFAPLHLLPWQIVVVLWATASTWCIWYMARAFAPLFIVGGLAYVAWSALYTIGQPLAIVGLGNVHLIMSAAIVAGMRYPAAWSIVAWTKIGPTVGLLWFPLRRQWRPFLVGCVSIGLLALVAWVVAPHLWSDWFAFAARSSGQATNGPPYLLRLALAVVVLVLGARRGWAWVVPIASGLAILVLYPDWILVTWLGAITLAVYPPGDPATREGAAGASEPSASPRYRPGGR